MDFNKGYKYNRNIKDGGANYNSSGIAVLLSLYEDASFNDSKISVFVNKVLTEKVTVSDFLSFSALYSFIDKVEMNDESKNYAMFELLEKLNVADFFDSLVVNLFLNDKVKAIDEISQLVALIEKQEDFKLNEINSIKAIIEIADKYNLNDAQKVLALISNFDRIRAMDRDPLKAISDFIVGQIDDKDKAYDWLDPFDLKIDWRSSSVQYMPQTESSYIEMPYVDGSIIENTTYKNRLFSIVAFSELGLDISEKEQLKYQITRILDSTKDKPKKLTFQASSTSFDVKYSGAAEITEGPSYIKATIPFEASPYGYPLFDKEVAGSGLIVNNGIKDTGCVHTIFSGAVNPSFQLGTITYTWNGTVPPDTKLVIDHNNYTCYLETVSGTRTNVIDKLTGEFQTIPKESSVVLTALGNTAQYIVTSIHEKILWLGG